MGNQHQIAVVYDFIDSLWRVNFGETSDFSNALYNGDFCKSLEQAQRDKHAYILEGIKFSAGQRILDIGCGWGNMLMLVEKAGGHAVGLTLSAKQAAACRRAGLDARVLDWREVPAESLGTFDAIVSLGAFEHFCSLEQYLEGEQETVYRRFFAWSSSLLVPKGRLYLQTQLWTEKTPPYERLSLKASKDSDEYILASIETLFPNSCLPFNLRQIELAANPQFGLVSHLNGRVDYIHTVEQWRNRVRRLAPSKLPIYCRMAAHFLFDPHFRYKFQVMSRPHYAEAFRRGLIDHERMIFEKL